MSDFDNLGDNFDPNTMEVGVLEPGVYTFMIRDANVKPTRNGKGTRLMLQLHGAEGTTYANVRFRDYTLTQHENPLAEDRGRFKLAGLFKAVDKLPKPSSASELIGLEVRARVQVEPASGGYRARNAVEEFLPLEDAVQFQDDM